MCQTDRIVSSHLGSLSFRRLCSGDVGELASFVKTCFEDPWTEEMLFSELCLVTCFSFGLWLNGKLVAIAINSLVAEELSVLLLGVASEYRQKGVATILMNELLCVECQSFGVRVAYLEVSVLNEPALSFYCSMGFRRIGLRKSYYRHNGADCILMSMEL